MTAPFDDLVVGGNIFILVADDLVRLVYTNYFIPEEALRPDLAVGGNRLLCFTLKPLLSICGEPENPLGVFGQDWIFVSSPEVFHEAMPEGTAQYFIHAVVGKATSLYNRADQGYVGLSLCGHDYPAFRAIYDFSFPVACISLGAVRTRSLDSF